MARTFTCLDPTRFSLPGADVPEPDPQAIALPQGSAQAHRPDWQQAVVELIVSQDGGVPLLSQRWDGHASATGVFKARGAARMAQLQAREPPRDVSADATVSTAAPASPGARLPCMPRMPATLNGTPQRSAQAWAGGPWQPLEETGTYQRVALGP